MRASSSRLQLGVARFAPAAPRVRAVRAVKRLVAAPGWQAPPPRESVSFQSVHGQPSLFCKVLRGEVTNLAGLSGGKGIKNIARTRVPASASAAQEQVLFALDERTLALERPPGTERSKAAAASSSAPTGRSYTFDAVLNDVGQAEVYTSDVQRMVRQVCAGLNAALILHGPTGGGKTYTAFGTEGGDIEQAGLCVRAAADLVEACTLINEDPELREAGCQLRLSVSALEVDFQEGHPAGRVKDLLLTLEQQPKAAAAKRTKAQGRLEGRAAQQKGKPGELELARFEFQTVEEFVEAAAVARAQRTSYATGSNQASSRSHMLLYCIAELVPREGCAPAVQLKPWSSALLFADLAGYELRKEAGKPASQPLPRKKLHQFLAALDDKAAQKVADSGRGINSSLFFLTSALITLGSFSDVEGTQFKRACKSHVLTGLLEPFLRLPTRCTMYTVVSRLAEASTVQLLRRTLEMGATASKAHTRLESRWLLEQARQALGSGPGAGGCRAAVEKILQRFPDALPTMLRLAGFGQDMVEQLVAASKSGGGGPSASTAQLKLVSASCERLVQQEPEPVLYPTAPVQRDLEQALKCSADLVSIDGQAGCSWLEDETFESLTGDFLPDDTQMLAQAAEAVAQATEDEFHAVLAKLGSAGQGKGQPALSRCPGVNALMGYSIAMLASSEGGSAGAAEGPEQAEQQQQG